MPEYDKLIWGKKQPFCSLAKHMIAVGSCVYEYLAAPSSAGILKDISAWLGLDKENAIIMAAYIAALHDIGKVYPDFQICNAADEGMFQTTFGYHRLYPKVHGFRHEAYGSEILKDTIWKEQGIDRKKRKFFSAIIAMHHQGKSPSQVFPADQVWIEIQHDLEQRMHALFKPSWKKVHLINCDALGVLLTSVLIIADWVASGDEFNCSVVEADTDLLMADCMKEHAADVLRRINLVSDTECSYPTDKSFTDFWTGIPRKGMRPLQKCCEEEALPDAALTIIEAPMGEGKTEAALFLAGKICAAYNKHGIYMALPTAATSNQMVERVRSMLSEHSAGNVRLLHSMAWLIDEAYTPAQQFETEDSDIASDWTRPLRRGMLFENAVGTVDQAMASVLRLRYGMLRLCGLAEKVLIIDEIHAYDIYMSTIIARLLSWCRALNIPVILLSATMQEGQKNKYLAAYGCSHQTLNSSYPLITQIMPSGELKQITVGQSFMKRRYRFETESIGEDANRLADYIEQRSENGGCICVMLNTVRKAQNLYGILKSRGEENILLFHARFPAYRRSEIEKECLEKFGKGGKRPGKLILICTQVVEQSLDVCFDTMITELAPMDLLLQRAGRVHRHEGNPRPETMKEPVITVIVPGKDSSDLTEERYGVNGLIYSPAVLKNTEQLLQQELKVCIPEDVRSCVEKAYCHIDGDDETLYIRGMVENRYKEIKAEGNILTEPKPDRFFGETNSAARDICLDEPDDASTVSGARTRDGGESVSICFLPEGFLKDNDSAACLRQAMQYSCSIRVTQKMKDEQEKQSIDYQRGSIMLEPETDGLYHWCGVSFSVDNEYGIMEVQQ